MIKYLARAALAAVVALALCASAHATNEKPLVIKGGVTQQLPSTDGLQLNAGSTSAPSLNLACAGGAAPTSPSDGDFWCTPSGLFIRAGGVTIGPLNGTGGSGGTCATVTNAACLNAAQSFTAGQAGTPVALSLSGATATPDLATGNNFSLMLVHATCPCTVANPTNQVAGQTGLLALIQSATGGDTVSWGGNFVFLSGQAPTLSSGAGAEDYFTYYVESSGRVLITQANSSNLAFVPKPQGRLTLTSGTPVLTTDTTAQSTIYYDCYDGGRFVPYYNGTSDQVDTITSCEVPLTLSSSEEATANVFDVGWFHNSGSPVLCSPTDNGGASGKGWAGSSNTGGSNTNRGTGGNAQLHNTRGYQTNVNALAHCFNNTTDYGSIPADQWTYLGSYYTTAAGQTGVQMNPGASAGGTTATVGLWNAYNRVPINVRTSNSNSSWTYTGTSVRAANNSTTYRISWLDGLALSSIHAEYDNSLFTTAGVSGRVGVGINSTTTISGFTPFATSNNTGAAYFTKGDYSSPPLLGLNFVQALENSTGSTTTFSSGSAAANGLRLESTY